MKKFMRKCVALLAAVLLLASGLSITADDFSVAGNPKLKVTVGEINEQATTVDVVVTLTTGTEIMNGAFTFNYDAEKLELIVPVNKAGRPTPNALSELPSSEVNVKTPGVVRVGFIATVEEGEVVVLKMTFNLKTQEALGTGYPFDVDADQLVVDNGTTNGSDLVKDTETDFTVSETVTVEHVYSEEWSHTEQKHWRRCTHCDIDIDEGDHVFDNICDTDCNTCGYVRQTTHTYEEGVWQKDDVFHWQECTVCSHKEKSEHTWGKATVSGRTVTCVCTVCKAERVATLGDLDGDGKTSSTDARMALQYFVGAFTDKDIDLDAADVDQSGTVDSTDARLMLQMFVGSITEFPAK